MDVPVPQQPELVIDLDLPARYPSRYRACLVAVTRLEVRVRFPFEPSVFRSAEVGSCDAEVLLAHGRQAVRLQGTLEPDRSGGGAKVRFPSPIGLPDYSFLRRFCGEEENGPTGVVAEMTLDEDEVLAPVAAGSAS